MGNGAILNQTVTSINYRSYSVAGRAVVNVDSTSGWWGVKLTRTNPDNYVRNIHCIMPGFWDTWQDEPFHPDFVATTERFKMLRFTSTRGSPTTAGTGMCRPRG